MKRRQFQINDSRFSVERRPQGWFVSETWQEIDRRGDKTDEFELHGPYDDRGQAEAHRARLVSQESDPCSDPSPSRP